MSGVINVPMGTVTAEPRGNVRGLILTTRPCSIRSLITRVFSERLLLYAAGGEKARKSYAFRLLGALIPASRNVGVEGYATLAQVPTGRG